MRYILVAFLIGAGPVAQAQTMVLAPMPVALDDLNSAFHGTVTFKLNGKGQLIADHFDASGRFRQDVMLVEHLGETAAAARLMAQGVHGGLDGGRRPFSTESV